MTPLDLYRQANIERAVEIFAVAALLGKVGLEIYKAPAEYAGLFSRTLLRHAEATTPTIAVIAYEADNLEYRIKKGANMEPIENVFTRMDHYVAKAKAILPYDNIVLNEAGTNILKSGISRMGWGGETVWAIHVVAMAISIMSDKYPTIAVDHVAEAMYYYCEMLPSQVKAEGLIVQVMERIETNCPAEYEMLSKALGLLK